MRLPLKTQRSWIIPISLGLAICLAFFLQIRKDASIDWIISTAALIAAAAAIAAITRIFLWDALVQRVLRFKKQWAITWAILSFVCGMWLVLNIPLPPPPAEYNAFIPAGAAKMVFRFSAAAGIGFILFAVSVWLADRNSGKLNQTLAPIKFTAVLKYAAPMMLVWGFYLLAFYPGMMSADSMVQWEQVLTGDYTDHHPVFHTLMIWLATRISLSPVAVAVAQIIAMALVAGAWLAFFDQLGIRRWIILVTAAVFAIIPVNGTMVNTLWKDIPYGIAVMGLTLLLARIAYSRGAWANGWGARTLLAVTIACVSLIRHDGLVLAVGTLFLVLLCFPAHWKSWLTTALVFAILYFGVRGPLYSWVKVQKSTVLAEATLSLFDMALYAVPGGEADAYLASMNIYPSNWTCAVWADFNPDWSVTSLDESQPLVQIAGNMLRNLPIILVYDYRCERSMEWIIWDPNGEVRNASHVQVLIDPNPYGLQAASKMPAVRDWIANWVMKTSQDTDINWLFWRPAIFLYITIFTTAILILRYRDPRFALLAVPVLLQAVTFTLIPAPPNFRYHYATYLVALISLPLLFSPGERKGNR